MTGGAAILASSADDRTPRPYLARRRRVCSRRAAARHQALTMEGDIASQLVDACAFLDGQIAAAVARGQCRCRLPSSARDSPT
ncbi:MAG: hypothetical protein R3F11_08905 [Verrucomicrobiales bacterium]